MVQIGLLGCGNVGRIVASHQEGFTVVSIFDKIIAAASEVATIAHATPYHDFEAFIQGPFELCVEAASIEAVQTYGCRALECGKDLVILSVGALADPTFQTRICDIARAHKKKIYVPSGAIMGLDNLKIGQISALHSITLRTTKPPSSLGLTTSTRELLFAGSATECIAHYPKNTNVSIALELATDHDVYVELWVDPDISHNTHEIVASGEFGEIYSKITNLPSPNNPTTSYLAALSILALLKTYDEPLVIGT
jgi:aspartate dehydrogenase